MSDKLGVPLSKIRRWAMEFLPPDPRATRQSGYGREHTDNDAWFFYLGGKIIEATGMPFKVIVPLMEEHIKPWCWDVGLIPDNTPPRVPKGIDKKIEEYSLTISTFPGLLDVAVKVKGLKAIDIPEVTYEDGDTAAKLFQDENGREYTKEKWEHYEYTLWFPPDGVKPKSDKGRRSVIYHEIQIQDVLFDFINDLYGWNEYVRWSENFYNLREP
jgi:hypothetical protein